MSLDCVTPRGRVFVADQREIADRFALQFGCGYIQTPDTREADIDALFHKNLTLTMAAEIKSRTNDLAQLYRWGSYLVTRDKLDRGREIALRLCVPYALIVGLTDAICHWEITDARGRWAFAVSSEFSKTQSTCNGGQSNRMNAYLPLTKMKVFLR